MVPHLMEKPVSGHEVPSFLYRKACLTSADEALKLPSQFGLLQVYPSVAPNVSPTTIDVIAIHGLDTSAPTTWEYRYQDPQGNHRIIDWLRDTDMLPAAIPHACIMTYNWPAKLYTNAVDLTLNNLAEGLWLDIHGRRVQKREPVDRPIVFIASCFGGLVIVKALYSAASKTSTYSYLRDATVGLVFLGTPFDGTPLQRQAQWLIAYGDLRGEETSKALVADLAVKSKNVALKELVDNFATSVNSANFYLPIQCFYEMRKTNLAKKGLPASLAKHLKVEKFLVDKDSASLRGFPNDYLDCTHVMMNKFAPGTNEYSRVASVIVDFVRNGSAVLAERSHKNIDKRKSALLNDLLKWVSNHQPLLNGRSGIQHPYTPPPLQEPPRWFTHTSPYIAWSQESRGVLWHRSEVGDGSSPLLYVASNIGATCTNLKVLHFAGLNAQPTEFFPDTKTPLNLSNAHPNQVLQALLLQYFQVTTNDESELRKSLQALVDSSDNLDDLRKMMGATRMSPLSDVSRVLRKLLSRPEDPRFILVIDQADLISLNDFPFLARFLDTYSKIAPVLISGTAIIGIDRHIPEARIVDKNTEYRECLQSLNFSAVHLRRDRVASADRGTNNWLLAHAAYEEFEKDASGVLWIEGKAGSGKSVLAKFLLQNLQSRPNVSKEANLKDVVVAWFYSKRDGKITMAHHSMLRSIVYQVLKESQKTFDSCSFCYQKRPLQPDGSSGEWSFDDLQDILRSIVSSKTPIICILDGLDESATNEDFLRTRKAILWNLIELALIPGSQIKFIMLSRPARDIAPRFPSPAQDIQHDVVPAKKCHKIVLQDENEQDILRIVENGLVAIKQAMESSKSCDNDDDDTVLGGIFQKVRQKESVSLDGIRSHLVDNAKGVILWVTLIIEQLIQHCRTGGVTVEELEKLLRSLPADLIEYYEYMIKELERKLSKEELTKSRKALMWVSGTSFLQAPTIRELWDALAIPEDVQKALQSQKDYRVDTGTPIKTWTGFRGILYEWCGPFIEVVRDTSLRYGAQDVRDQVEPHYIVQLLHQTVKDFLADEKTSSTLRYQSSDARNFVADSVQVYLQIVLPQKITVYTQFRTAHHGEDFTDKLIYYLNDKFLLRFSLMVFRDYCIRETKPKTNILVRLSLQIWCQFVTSSNQIVAFVVSACLKASDVALENMLQLCSSTLVREDWRKFRSKCLDGALVAAARVDSLALVRRVLSYNNRKDRAKSLREKAVQQGKLQLATALSDIYESELYLDLRGTPRLKNLQYDMAAETFGLRRLMISERAREYGVQRHVEGEDPLEDPEKTELCIDKVLASFGA